MSQLNDKLINYGNLAEFHIKLLNDLVTSDKSTWSSEKIQEMIADAGFAVELVAQLPASGDPHTIYFVPSSNPETSNVKDEFMYINGTWEQVGSTAIDLTPYATKTELNSGLALKQDVLTAGQNISIDANKNISAEGFVFDKSKGAIAEQYFDDDNNVIATNTATGIGAHAEGYSNIASGDYGSHAEGYLTKATYTSEGGYNHGVGAHAEGWSTEAKHDGAHAEGTLTLAAAQGAHAEGAGAQNELVQALGIASHAEGVKTIARNRGEHAEGFRNISHTTGSQTGDSGSDTMHSVGVGTNNLRRNAEEIMQNGDMYVFGIGNYDGIHIKNEQGAPANTQTLQDVISDINTSVAGKQNTLTAGTNIEISGNTISATYEVATTADIEALFASAPTYPARNQLWYTTSNGQTCPLDATNDGIVDEAAQLTSNVYQNGKGIATFDCERIGLQYSSNSYGEKSTLTAVWLPYITEEGWMINMFGGQENLTNIYYPGTVDELADVFKYSGALYNAGTNIIHCSDGDFTVPAGS